MAENNPIAFPIINSIGGSDIVLVESFKPVLEEGENIVCFSCHRNNLIVGKSKNRIMFFEVFDKSD